MQKDKQNNRVKYRKIKRITELGASLFEIAQSLFALEQTLIMRAMALNKNKSKERRAN